MKVNNARETFDAVQVVAAQNRIAQLCYALVDPDAALDACPSVLLSYHQARSFGSGVYIELRLEVWGLLFRVEASGSGVHLGLRLQGEGLRVWGFGFRVEGVGCRIWGFGCRVQRFTNAKRGGKRGSRLGWRRFLENPKPQTPKPQP